MTRAVALLALACCCASGCSARPLVVPGPGDGSRDFTVVDHDLGVNDLAGADLTGADLAGLDLSATDLPGVVVDMAMVPLPQTHGGSVGTGVAVLAADLDGDGDQDLVVVGAAGTVRIYNGNGKGALFPRQAFEINTNTVLATGVLADVDADGVLDLVLAEPGGSKSEVDVLRGNGDATFGDWARILIPGGVTSVAVGDLNDDGVPDLVASTADDLLHVMRGMAGGKPLLLTPTYSLVGRATQLATAELTGDDNLDVVEIDEDGASFITGDGNFGFVTNVTVPAPSHAVRFVLGDFDFNGDPDIAVAGHTGAVSPFDVVLQLIDDEGSGDGGNHAFDVGLTTTTGFVGLALGDLDGDGIPDLIISSDGQPVLQIYAGNGIGGFSTPPRSIDIDEGATSLALADFDNDGHLDVAAAGATKTQLYLTRP